MYSPSRLLEVGQVLILWAFNSLPCLPTCHSIRHQGKVKSVSQSVSQSVNQHLLQTPCYIIPQATLPCTILEGNIPLAKEKKNDIYYYLPTDLPRR